MIPSKDFLSLVDRLISEYHLTQNAFAVKVGFSPSAISRWRNGITESAQPQHIAAIEKAFGLSITFNAGEWTVLRSDDVDPETRAKSSGVHVDFSRTAWTSEEDRKKFYETIQRLADADPQDREAIYRIISSMGK